MSILLPRYCSIELTNFINCYNSFLGLLDEKQKRYVLCLNELLPEIFSNKDGLKKLRDNWAAHIQDRDKFKHDISDMIKKEELTESTDDYLLMIGGVRAFVMALRHLFPKEWGSVCSKFYESSDANMQRSRLDRATLQKINGRISRVCQKIKLEGAPFYRDEFRRDLKKTSAEFGLGAGI